MVPSAQTDTLPPSPLRRAPARMVLADLPAAAPIGGVRSDGAGVQDVVGVHIDLAAGRAVRMKLPGIDGHTRGYFDGNQGANAPRSPWGWHGADLCCPIDRDPGRSSQGHG